MERSDLPNEGGFPGVGLESGSAVERETSRAFRTLIGNLPGLVYRCRNEPAWTAEFVGGKCEELTGYPPEAMLGNRDISFAELIHAEDRESVWHEIQGALDKRKPYQLTYRIQCREGAEKWVWEQGCGVFHPQTGELQALEGYVVDITEQKRLEERLAQAAKMEAIGRLAGGVAHDFNNLLLVILTCTELVRDELSLDDPNRAELDQALKAAARAATLTRQLLAFSRQQVIEPRPVDLNAIITSMEPMLRRLLGERVELTVRPGLDVAAVLADPSQFEQVVLNLVANGRDAMPDGGELTLETANVDPDEARAEQAAEAPSRSYVMLAVSDTGEGMDAPTRARMFEPFFSTKGVGHGTGLGLAIVYGVVKQCGGYIDVVSEPGHGTTFKLFWPCYEGTYVERTSLPGAALARGAHELVLVVDDDELVRAAVTSGLTRDGYAVLAACSAEDALALAREHHGKIDVLLTDVVMPGKSGIELARELQEMNPELVVLLVSGYTDGLVNTEIEPGFAFLQKPYTTLTLAAKIRESLSSRAARSS